MPNKLDRAAELAGEAVGSIEGATQVAKSAIGKRTRPAREAIAEVASEARRVGEREVATATNKASGARKAAKRRGSSTTTRTAASGRSGARNATKRTATRS